jgi:hypothetical protein
MIAHSHPSDLARELTVVYADFPGRAPAGEVCPILDFTFLLWPRRVCDAANESRLVLHREMLDVIQRNLNASLSLLKRLAGARNLGETLELQAGHFSNQLAAAVSQSEELTALWIKTALAFARDAYPAHPRIKSPTQRGTSETAVLR